MNRNTFNRCIKESNFRELFITEMGWNNYAGQSDIPTLYIDEVGYDMRTIAERNGFQILHCSVGKIPTPTTCKKIDLKLRRWANDYICIYSIPESEHHQWVAPIKNVEKRELVTIEYETAAKADFLFSKIGGLSFDLDERTTIMDVKERIQEAFAINSADVTKSFYAGFQKEHKAFAEFICGVDDHIAVKDNRNKQWYTSVMLNRLMFCYFIQKKGFLDNDVNYLRNKLEWCQREKGEDRFFSSFYKGFLSQMFHDGLNNPAHSDEFESVYGRIPYLNGGMFDEHQIEKDYEGLDISDDAFVRLFDFFDKWRWHLDTRITASGKDINPDVLGYIFEQYINDRAQMGAYYTKEDITEYIGKNCILPFLFDAVKATSSAHDFKDNGYVWSLLKNSGDAYIYDAVKKGYSANWRDLLPGYIANGLDTSAPNLLERRARWNERTAEAFALPTEIWRETIERLQRCEEILGKISSGSIHEINDFITYNLNIRQFAYDLLAGTEDHLFVKHFYHALQNVTILDPTCGSGAFLFAAMNIMEPLYEICIERMEEFHAKNNKLFEDELGEIANKYRSNIQYFIYKSIILRNLYGVDIMVEATEIAKLRLFLKMVAVVEVDRRADNLGLDPLPDIDFNIRCGNTLVGYATEAELYKDLSFATDILQVLANEEFKTTVEAEMDKVAMTYERFKEIQLRQAEDMASFKTAKNNLRTRLVALNELLNHRLHSATAPHKQYDEWLASHQPFHWLAEFYQIMHDRGGFDVIIGNPPYVVYTDTNCGYRISETYTTRECSNLYAFCIERSKKILSLLGRFGMIVPNSSISANKMLPVQKEITNGQYCWISNYSWRPSKLFEGADMLLAIIINAPSNNNTPYVKSTIYQKWYNEYRNVLFQTISYTDVTADVIEGSIPKAPSEFAMNIIRKMKVLANEHVLPENFKPSSPNKLFYFRAVQYWFKVLDREPIYEEDGVHKVTGEMKPIYADNEDVKNIIIAVLSSSLFFVHYIIWASCQVVNSRDFNFYIDLKCISDKLFKELANAGRELQNDYQANSHVKERFYSKKGREFTMQKQHFYIKYSKPIIDQIDCMLGALYKFNEEELDFIINYDIKYRMGDELNE